MFVSQLVLTADPIPDFWVVGPPLIWQDKIYGHIEVPAGTRTDLASIPRALRNLPFLDPDGQSRRPAVVHDYLYGSAFGHRLGKSFADDFLRAALLAEGASPGTARAFYWAVHLFGGGPWDEYRAKSSG